MARGKRKGDISVIAVPFARTLLRCARPVLPLRIHQLDRKLFRRECVIILFHHVWAPARWQNHHAPLQDEWRCVTRCPEGWRFRTRPQSQLPDRVPNRRVLIQHLQIDTRGPPGPGLQQQKMYPRHQRRKHNSNSRAIGRSVDSHYRLNPY